MTKIIGLENEARINAELEALMEEVKKRTKTTITGVRVTQLPSTNTLVDTDEIIVEQQDGTKRFQVSGLGLSEVIEARTDNEQVPVVHKNLKERLDNMNTKVNDNNRYITDLTGSYNLLNKEVADARNSATNSYPTLKDRLNAMDTTVTNVQNSVNNINTDISDIRDVANEANTKADNAVVTANTANQTATQANQTANSASAKADQAELTATQAELTANDASNKANNAVGVANTASQTANNANQTATQASQTVQQVQIDVQQLTTTLNSVKKEVDDAKGNQTLKDKIDGLQTLITQTQTTANNANQLAQQVEQTTNNNTAQIGNIQNTQTDHDNRIANLEANQGNVKEVEDARTDAGGVKHQTLSERLNADSAKTEANTLQINNILSTMIKYKVI